MYMYHVFTNNATNRALYHIYYSKFEHDIMSADKQKNMRKRKLVHILASWLLYLTASFGGE